MLLLRVSICNVLIVPLSVLLEFACSCFDALCVVCRCCNIVFDLLCFTLFVC